MHMTVVSRSELAEAGSWLARDFLSTEPEVSCVDCGLAPSASPRTFRGRHVGSVASRLLVREQGPAWVESKGIYRCRNREACARRQRLRVR